MRKPPDIVICECWPEEPDDHGKARAISFKEAAANIERALARLKEMDEELDRKMRLWDPQWKRPF